MTDLPHLPLNVSHYGGMTVNERLCNAGLIAQFDAAARARDRTKMVALINSVELGDQSETIADAILRNPSKYGY